MSATPSRLIFGLSLLLFALAAPAQNSLRCSDGLVNLGDGTWQVRKVCGEPDHRAHQTGVDLAGGGVVASVRAWYYNQGPQSFLRVLYFRDGDLDRIARVGRGFRRIPDRRCTPRFFDTGQSKFEIEQVCGEPQFKETRFRRDGRHGLQWVEEWVYDFGPRRFARELEFIDGQLADVETIDP